MTLGHVNNDGFGAYVFRSPTDVVIPYLVYLSINEDGNLEVEAPTPWQGDDGFTVYAVLTRE